MTAQSSFAFPAPAPRDLETPARTNLVIEAGAGTGKTTRIVAEVLRLMLANEHLSPDRIVLVTFTEKAAGEIADRIREALTDLASRFDEPHIDWPSDSANPLIVVPDGEREAWKRACLAHLAQIDTLRSQTIHSFCQSLLRTFPIEANLDPQFKIIQGFERSLLHGEIYELWIDHETRTHSTPGQVRDWELVFEQFNYLFQVRDMLFAIVDRRDLLEEDLSLGEIADIEQTLIDGFTALAAADAEGINDREVIRLIEFARSNPVLPRGSTIEDWLDYMRPVASPLRNANLPLKKKHEPAKVAVAALRGKDKGKSIYDRLVSHRAAEALLRIARRFVAYLDDEKRKLGVADFDDLLLRTDLLLDQKPILDRARAQFDTIFVDEFQDTDRTQARIITKLCTDEWGQWIPGRTIVVGDPKQSIYGFRRADPETYARMTRAMIDAGARRDEIRDQYRSDPPLLDDVNTVFTALFGEGSDDPNVFSPRYLDLRAGRPRSSRELDARLTFLHSHAEDGEERPRAEAEAIVAWLEAHRDRKSDDLRRFAILFRRTTQLDDYLDVFDRHGIDYVLPPTRMFLDRRTAVDLLSVLRAIAYPFDLGAQISAARTPYFALTDDEVSFGVLYGSEPRDESGAWIRFRDAIAAMRAIAAHFTVLQLVDHVIDATGIEAVFAAAVERERALRHLEHLRSIAFTFDQQSNGSVREFVDQIAMRRIEPDEMEPSLTDPSRNAVRIMTTHAAKGLEFDTVILPDLEFPTSSNTTFQIFATDEPPRLVVAGQLETISGAYPRGDSTLKKVAGERDEAEIERLLYVGVTRAKAEVVFVINASDDTKAIGFRKTLNKVFGLEKKQILPWPKDDGVNYVTVTIGERSAIVAFEKRSPTLARGSRLSRLRDAAVIGDSLAPDEISAPAPLDATLSHGDVARLRARSVQLDAGLLLHRLLELWDGSSDADALLRQLVIEAGADERASKAVRQRLATLRKSASFRRILGAECVGREVTIRIADASGRAIERRVDRLIREGGHEVVVDYKSGRPDPRRLEGDRAQVAAYCRAITMMTTRPCSGLLWYVDLESDATVEVEA